MDPKLMQVARALVGERPIQAGSIPRPQLPNFLQPGADFNDAMPPLAANSRQQPMAMAQQTVAAPSPPGLLPAMQPGTQIGDNAAYSGVRANWRPEDQAALQAILDQQKQAATQQASAAPSWWANPWQAP